MILSLGSVNADFQLCTERWPQPGETLVGREFLLAPGGKAGNVAVLARRLGVAATLLGRVGTDALEDGEKTILFAGNANKQWNEQDVAAMLAAIGKAPAHAVLVADLEVPAALVEQAAAAARRRGIKVVLDPSPAGAMRDALYSLCDVITPNASEAGALAGMEVSDLDSAARAAERLLARKPGAVVVKAPHGDCVLGEGERVRRLKGVEAHAVDATGAGDAFAGALAVALFERRALEEAVLIGMAAAACAVERYGAQASYPSRGALEARLQRVRELNQMSARRSSCWQETS